MARAPQRTTQRTPDLERIAGGLADMRVILEDIQEKAERSDAKADRASARLSAVEADTSEQREKLGQLIQRTDNGMNEMLATQTSAYRQFTSSLDDFKHQLEGVQSQIANVQHGVNTGAEVAAKATADRTVKGTWETLLSSPVAWLVAVGTGFVTIVSAFKNIPPAFRFIGDVTVAAFTWIIKQKGG